MKVAQYYTLDTPILFFKKIPTNKSEKKTLLSMKKLPKLDENNVCLGRLAAKVRWYAEKITLPVWCSKVQTHVSKSWGSGDLSI